ncbi:MAG: peptidoglycan DD-metalloendopeptidase family protein [Anaerolineae bacterium]
MRDNLAESDSSPISPEEWGPGYRLWDAMHALLGQRGPEGTTPLVRMASHLVILLIAVAVLLISRVELPRWEIAEAQQNIAAAEEPQAPAAPREAAAAGALVRAAVPFTLIPDRPRLAIITHTVEAGDTLYGIAEKYNISVETLMWANNLEQNPDLLRLGQELVVLPVNGVYHTVQSGDTVESVAQKYKARPEDILKFPLNNLNPKNPTLTVGQKIVVPGGSKPYIARQVQIYGGPVPQGASRGSGRLIWPASGSITQGYFWYHRAIDIGSYVGNPVRAADSGYVVVAGWSDVGYGYYIVLDHGNGIQTLYAHLSRIFVNAGDSVGQGTVIGHVGSTGNSTGPHLHFEVRRGGVQQNPFNYLP